MKLYELKKGQRFKLDGYDDVFTFIKIDGMYSNIITEKGDLVYYAAFAECQLVGDEDDE
jgi:hypothetical protein